MLYSCVVRIKAVFKVCMNVFLVSGLYATYSLFCTSHGCHAKALSINFYNYILQLPLIVAVCRSSSRTAKKKRKIRKKFLYKLVHCHFDNSSKLQREISSSLFTANAHMCNTAMLQRQQQQSQAKPQPQQEQQQQ